MTDAADFFSELPELPKAKRGSFKEILDFVKLAHEEALMPQATAARLMGMSRQAVADLVKRGRIREFRTEQGTFISGKDVIAYWIQQNGGKAVPFHGKRGPGKKLGLALEGFKDAIKENT